jgi:hypothetical protein
MTHSREVKIDLVDLSALPYVPAEEDERVVTVRMPRSLHAELVAAADRIGTSLNLLCISKLVAEISNCPIVPFGSTYRRAEFAEVRDQKLITRRCRICRCTEADCKSCIERTGEPCHWVEWDLCSACAPVAANQEQR